MLSGALAALWSLARLESVFEESRGRLEASWSRFEGVLEASWSVLERLGGVLERLGALLQAIWPDAENVEKPLVFLACLGPGRSWKRLGGLLERLGGILETSWSRLGAAAGTDAAFDAGACSYSQLTLSTRGRGD